MKRFVELGLLIASALAGCGPGSEVVFEEIATDAGVPDASARTGSQSDRIAAMDAVVRDAEPVPEDELLGLVSVWTRVRRLSCTGAVISRNRVIVAATCVCEVGLVGEQRCDAEADVFFREGESTTGSVTAHPGYNPSWTDRETENNIAVIALPEDAPPYATPFVIRARPKPDVGASVVFAGRGPLDLDCRNQADYRRGQAKIGGYRDGGRILSLTESDACLRDFGGVVLDVADSTLVGIRGNGSQNVSHATVMAAYYDWVRSLTCSDETWGRCDGSAEMCRCGGGYGDCDDASDCMPFLDCREDVGPTFGYPAGVDVCLAPGPIGGTCTCSDSGVGGMCASFGTSDRCSAGFLPQCSPKRKGPGATCGGCTCVP